MDLSDNQIDENADGIMIPIERLHAYANALLGIDDEERVNIASEILLNLAILKLNGLSDVPSGATIEIAHQAVMSEIRNKMFQNSMQLSNHEEVCE